MLTKQGVLSDTLKGSVKGGLYENLIVGILERNGFQIRYCKNDDREVEFIVETEDGVVPIEVKATHGRSRSLDELLRSKDLSCGYKFTGGNVCRQGKKITMPHYMAMFLRRAEMEISFDFQYRHC